jgi:hypothetical protein
MKSARGKCDGAEIILEEDSPVDHEARVIVTFFDEKTPSGKQPARETKWHWEESRKEKA